MVAAADASSVTMTIASTPKLAAMILERDRSNVTIARLELTVSDDLWSRTPGIGDKWLHNVAVFSLYCGIALERRWSDSSRGKYRLGIGIENLLHRAGTNMLGEIPGNGSTAV